MSKTKETQSILDQRREDMLKVLDGGLGTEDDADSKAVDNSEGQEPPAEGAQSRQSDGNKKISGKHVSRKKSQKPPQKGIASDNPLVQKALRRSTTQKTLRFPPMLIVEYEQSCLGQGIEPNFNAHMTEALELWLARNGKLASTRS